MITREKIDEVCALREQGVNLTEMGRQVGFHRDTVRKIVRKYMASEGAQEKSADGAPPSTERHNRVIDSTDIDGTVELVRLERPASPQELQKLAQLDEKKWRPKHVRINTWQGFAKIQENLKKIQLHQSRVTFERLVTEPVERAIAEYVRENVRPLPKPKRKLRTQPVRPEPYMVVLGWWDTHLGMYAWNKEVGEDFDLDIAMRRMHNSVDDLVQELAGYPVGRVVMPIGNDLLHYDSVKKTTTFGEHHLDCDMRYSKVYLGALQCLTYIVEQVLDKVADKVELLYVPGNHDYTSGFTLCVALDQRFLNDDRVTSSLDMNPRKYVRHGGCLIGFDHGKDVKPAQYPVLVACENTEGWDSTTWREMQIGHTHQRRETFYRGVTPTNGVLVRTNPSLSGTDYWHHGKGFLGEPVRSVEAWRYDSRGYRGSHVALARDD